MRPGPGLLAAFRTRLGPGYATATPDTLQRRFLDTPGTITSHGDTITVTLSRRAYSPVCAVDLARTILVAKRAAVIAEGEEGEWPWGHVR